MGLKKKTIKLVTKILGSDKKRKLYADEEINYMERQLQLLILERQRRKLSRKREKGFGYDNKMNFDD